MSETEAFKELLEVAGFTHENGSTAKVFALTPRNIVIHHFRKGEDTPAKETTYKTLKFAKLMLPDLKNNRLVTIQYA